MSGAERDIAIEIKDSETDEVVETVWTSKAKFDRVLSGLSRKVDFDRFYIDYPDEED